MKKLVRKLKNYWRNNMLYFTIGLPRSGKSTFADNWVEELEYHKDGYDGYSTSRKRVIVSGDNIRLALTGQRFSKDAEQMVQAIKWVMVKALLDRGHEVMIDGTHTTNSSIEKILSIDPEARGIFIDRHPRDCEKTAMDCGHYDLVGSGVIRRMVNNLKELKPEYKERFGVKAEWL